MSAGRPALRALAERLGIVSSYWDLTGRERVTSDATREALLAAMRVDASDERAATSALAALEDHERARWLEPVLVWREYAGSAPAVPLRIPPGIDTGSWRLTLHEEGGAAHVNEGRLPPASGRDAAGRVTLPLPCTPPPGYHELELEVQGAGFAQRARQRFVMAPRTACGVDERPGARGAFGLWANLYTLRSRTNQGFGDLGDLGSLLAWCAEAGGAFVGVNPLHAIAARGLAITPYSPVSRLYRSVLYLDVEAVPELAACDAARAVRSRAAYQAERARLRAAHTIDYGAVLDAKLALLRPLFACFRASGSTPRAAAFGAWRAHEGEALEDFAAHQALAERFGAPGAPASDWRAWPEPFRDPRGPAVAAFRREQAEAVTFHAWLQFELDRQLAAAAERGRAAGLAIGLYQDLAIGSAPGSADTWMARDLFAQGATVGAPPDDYAPGGQDWGFPPLDPHRLRADGYRLWSRLLRAGFAHAGALRIDHAMAMARLFWIPEGRPGSEGAYVRAHAGEMLGVLALESRRAGALVIAEDLGTVPPEFRERLAEWDVLSSAVAWFERDGARFRPVSAWPVRALATIGTHDLVPLAGHRDGVDLRIRRRAGQIEDDEALAAALVERAREHAGLLALLREEGLLEGEGEPPEAELCAAVHALLAAAPSVLVAASLDDLAGEREPVNVPGVPVERHRSWSRRMARSLEELRADPRVAAQLGALRARRGL
ncbi:MAG: 4-alpha-glucanotransferase [Deltaproteobacteria bacterium]|nr:4-alpha-glucanotransferase [Deltaproteobacteria bacterium]